MITITVKDEQLRQALARLHSKLADMTPVMEQAGEAILLSVKRNFEEEGRPTPWKKSKRKGQTLTDSDTLRNSFTANADSKSVTVGTIIEYAPHHQFGTRPYIIRPKNKQALNIPGIGPRKKVNHPGLPARPFLMLQKHDMEKILRLIAKHTTQ